MTVADRFQDAIEKLADDTAAQARRIANRRNISKADKAVRLAALLNRANASATGLADSATSRQLESLTGRPAPARGLLPTDGSDRLLKSARTVLADPDPLERVERLARSEPLATGQSSVTEALSGRKHGRGGYIGWVRQLNANACDLCTHWARGGRVFPATHGMATHPACGCVQQLVLTKTAPKPVRRKQK